MKQAQARCRRWRRKGDKRSLAAADRLEAKFRDHPDYESDYAWFIRVQSGEFQRANYYASLKRRR
jgi:uncharacterized protein involved in type VI secretion and phage assembly